MAGGSGLSNGRVEICRNQLWGTVCDNGWETVDASVACRQLGFSAISEWDRLVGFLHRWGEAQLGINLVFSFWEGSWSILYDYRLVGVTKK